MALPLALLLGVLVMPRAAVAWGGPHGTITRAALATLPGWQKERLGDAELSRLARQYCAIPDLVYSDAELAPYAAMDSRPGVRYIVNLHLPAAQAENYEILLYFVGKAVKALEQGNVVDGARYMGTLTHAIEDWGCPAHVVPDDNMFTLFKQFLPPPAEWEHKLLHGPIENGTLNVDIGDYAPRLLGESIAEAAWNLLQRANEAVVNARGQVVPIIQGLYVDDTNAVHAAQMDAAAMCARVVADGLNTVFCLAAKRFAPEAEAVLRTVDLSARACLEAKALAMPQSSFFSKPYWGYAKRGIVLREGREPVPLRLRVPEGDAFVVREFTAGIGTGTRGSLSYLLPAGVYSRFEAWAGLHAELGDGGNVVFEVKGDGKLLARLGPVSGPAAAQRVSVRVGGITNLQLVVSSAGGDGLANYAVWGAPTLVK